MNIKKTLHYLSLIACIAIIASCFLPWVHIVPINTTLTGYNVKPFASGTNYGRGGLWITIFSVLSFIFVLLPYNAAKRTNMFVCAMLLAYTISRYTIFTASLNDVDVIKMSGIYLIVLLSVVMLVCSLFPYLKRENA